MAKKRVVVYIEIEQLNKIKENLNQDGLKLSPIINELVKWYNRQRENESNDRHLDN